MKNKWDGICKGAEHKLIVTTEQMRWVYLLPHQCVDIYEFTGLQNCKVLEKLSSPPSHLLRPVFMKQQISALNSITHYHHNFCTWATYLLPAVLCQNLEKPFSLVGTLNLYPINSYYNPVMNAHLSSFYSCENWGLEMLSNLSKVTQLVNGIQPNSVWIWSPCSFLHDFTTFIKKCLFSASLVPLFCITFAMDWMMPSQNVYVEALTSHMIVFEDGPSGGI